MRIVLQRVTEASVSVDGEVVGRIGHGFLVLLGVSDNDDETAARRAVEKISKLRIFSDENGKTNLSSKDIGGEILVVSQFTLYADCRHGNRPGFTRAGKPEHARAIYEYFTDYARGFFLRCEHGIFGADMQVSLTNDGPFTLVLEDI